MAREPLLQSPADRDDDDRDLRPQRMRNMVGQREVYARLEIAVDAASKRGSPWATSCSTARPDWAKRPSPCAFRTT